MNICSLIFHASQVFMLLYKSNSANSITCNIHFHVRLLTLNNKLSQKRENNFTRKIISTSRDARHDKRRTVVYSYPTTSILIILYPFTFHGRWARRNSWEVYKTDLFIKKRTKLHARTVHNFLLYKMYLLHMHRQEIKRTRLLK